MSFYKKDKPGIRQSDLKAHSKEAPAQAYSKEAEMSLYKKRN